jgi:uncharacterized membrane protein
MTGVVEKNIQALLSRRNQEEKTKRFQDRMADAISRFTGSMTFVYIHLTGFGLWIIISLGWTPLPAFDPTFCYPGDVCIRGGDFPFDIRAHYSE